MGSQQSQLPPPWEKTTIANKHAIISRIRAERSAEDPFTSACRRYCCESSFVDKGPPLVISREPAKCFAPATKSEEEEDRASSSDEFEHLAGAMQAQQKASNSKASMQKMKSSKHSKRQQKFKQIAKKAGLKGKAFDHESSFHVDASSAKGPDNTADDVHGSAKLSWERPPFIAALLKGAADEFLNPLNPEALTKDSVDRTDKFGQTGLFWAVGFPNLNVPVIERLLALNASVNIQNQYGYTPLMRTLRRDHIDMAKILIKAQANVRATDKFGSTCLYTVAAAGMQNAVEYLLSLRQGQEQLNTVDSDFITPLIAAARAGHQKVCLTLLKAHADADAADSHGRTALLYAFAHADGHLADVLMEHGAELDKNDEHGSGILANLVENCVHHAQHARGTLSGIMAALEAKADVDMEDEDGRTPLMLAALGNAPGVCALLAVYGANMATTDNNGKTAIATARRLMYMDVLAILADFGGASKTASDALNKALLRATYYGNAEAIEVLVDRGAAHDAKSANGTEAVTIASRIGNHKVAKVLREAAEIANSDTTVDVAGESEESMGNVEVRQRWAEKLHEVAARAKRVRAAMAMEDANELVDVLTQVRERPLAEQGKTAASKALAEHVKYCELVTAHHCLEQLRRVRAAFRVEKLTALQKDVSDWATQPKTLENTLLKTLQSHSAGVRGTQASHYENADEHTEEVEEVEVKVCGGSLGKAFDVCSTYTEEATAKGEMPPEERMKIVLKPSQCCKCLGLFGNEKNLERHAQTCQSTAAKEHEFKLMLKQHRAIQSAIFMLSAVASTYEDHAGNITQYLEELRDTKKVALRKYPEAVAVIDAARAFCRLLLEIAKTRGKECCDFIAREEETHGLNADDTATKECPVCMLRPATRACFHLNQKVRPCLCLCNGCAYEHSLKLQAQSSLRCPSCGERVDFISATDVT